MTNPYTYAFGSITLHPTAQDHQPMVESPPLISSVRHVPYSNLVVVDLGGFAERTFKTQIRVASEDVVAIEQAKGQTHPLRVAGVLWPSATLLKLDNHVMTPRGEYHLYDAEWLVG